MFKITYRKDQRVRTFYFEDKNKFANFVVLTLIGGIDGYAKVEMVDSTDMEEKKV